MNKARVIRLVLLASGTMLALGGCTGGWLPWAVGAGLAVFFSQQQAA